MATLAIMAPPAPDVKIDLTDRHTFDALTPGQQRRFCILMARRAAIALPSGPTPRRLLSILLGAERRDANWICLHSAVRMTILPTTGDDRVRMAYVAARNAAMFATYQDCDGYACESAAWEARHVAGCLKAADVGTAAHRAALASETAAQVEVLQTVMGEGEMFEFYPDTDGPARPEWVRRHRDTADERPDQPYTEDELFTVDPLPLIDGDDGPLWDVADDEPEGQGSE